MSNTSSSLSSLSHGSLHSRARTVLYDPLSAPTLFISRTNLGNSKKQVRSQSVKSLTLGTARVGRRVNSGQRLSAIASRKRLKENYAPMGMLDSQTTSQDWFDHLLAFPEEQQEPPCTPTIKHEQPQFTLSAWNGEVPALDLSVSHNTASNPKDDVQELDIKFQVEARVDLPAFASGQDHTVPEGETAGFSAVELVAMLRTHCSRLREERDQLRGKHWDVLQENQRLKELCQKVGRYVHDHLSTI